MTSRSPVSRSARLPGELSNSEGLRILTKLLGRAPRLQPHNSTAGSGRAIRSKSDHAHATRFVLSTTITHAGVRFTCRSVSRRQALRYNSPDARRASAQAIGSVFAAILHAGLRLTWRSCFNEANIGSMSCRRDPALRLPITPAGAKVYPWRSCLSQT